MSRPLAAVSPAVAAYLEALAGQGRGSGTLAGYRKTLAAAERALGGPLVDAGPDAWAPYIATLEARQGPETYNVTCRSLRRFLLWAGTRLPDALVPGAAVDPVPPAWRAALEGWELYQRAGGAPRTTIRTRREHVAQYAAHAGTPSPADVTTGSLLAWLGSHEHWSPETRYGHRGSLRAFFRWAQLVELIAADPAAALPPVRRPAPVARPLPPDDLRDALTAAVTAGDERLALLLTLAAHYGLRRAEIARVHTRDLLSPAVVTRETGNGVTAVTVHELVVHGKGGKTRRVPLAPDVAQRIAAARGFLFPGSDAGHLSPRWVGKLLSRALPEGFTAHTGRHLFATTAYAARGDLLTLQSLLGHSSAETTRRYVELDPARRRDVVNAVVGELRGTEEPTADLRSPSERGGQVGG